MNLSPTPSFHTPAPWPVAAPSWPVAPPALPPAAWPQPAQQAPSVPVWPQQPYQAPAWPQMASSSRLDGSPAGSDIMANLTALGGNLLGSLRGLWAQLKQAFA